MNLKKAWILIVITAVLISLSACSKKIDEVPKQDNQEVSENNTVKPNENEQHNKEEEQPEDPAVKEEVKEKAFKIPDFTSTDLDGNEVTDGFFANNKLTVLNIWTTT